MRPTLVSLEPMPDVEPAQWRVTLIGPDGLRYDLGPPNRVVEGCAGWDDLHETVVAVEVIYVGNS